MQTSVFLCMSPFPTIEKRKVLPRAHNTVSPNVSYHFGKLDDKVDCSTYAAYRWDHSEVGKVDKLCITVLLHGLSTLR